MEKIDCLSVRSFEVLIVSCLNINDIAPFESYSLLVVLTIYSSTLYANVNFMVVEVNMSCGK